MKKRLNVGVLGAANIAKQHMIPAICKTDSCQFWGVASRQLPKAQSYLKDLAAVGLPQAAQAQAVEGYDALVQHPDVDIIYNALPNDLHVPYAIKALEAGKHILCEKPIGLNQPDVQRLQEAAQRYPNSLAMEAFMYRFHPQWQRIQNWIDSNLIGDIRSISTQFCYYRDDPSDIRNMPEAGGGALMDIGCYGISAARMILQQEPKQVIATASMHKIYGVDNGMHMILAFENDVCATVMVNTKTQQSQSVIIEGSHGRITVSHPFYADKGDKRTLYLEANDSNQVCTFDAEIDQYQLMLESFSQAVLDQQLLAQDNALTIHCSPLPLQDSIANMSVIDAAFKSVNAKSWVSLD